MKVPERLKEYERQRTQNYKQQLERLRDYKCTGGKMLKKFEQCLINVTVIRKTKEQERQHSLLLVGRWACEAIGADNLEGLTEIQSGAAV